MLYSGIIHSASSRSIVGSNFLTGRIQIWKDEADVGRALAGGVAEGSTARERLARTIVFCREHREHYW